MSTDKKKVLIVDDESSILDFLQYNFEKEGYEVFTASNGVKAIKKAIKHEPDLIILDVMMPKMDGIEVCQLIRDMPQFEETKILFLTARSEDFTEIAGFDAGADDFVTKPIRLKALLARVKSLLKRNKVQVEQQVKNEVIYFGDLSIDLEKRQVKKGNKSVSLPKKEFQLLYLLSSKPERVFTREEIYTKIWGNDIIVGQRTLDVHIRKLRKSIGKEYIVTSKGIGYSFTY